MLWFCVKEHVKQWEVTKTESAPEEKGPGGLQVSFARSGTFECPSSRKPSYSGQSKGRGITVTGSWRASDGTLVAQAVQREEGRTE